MLIELKTSYDTVKFTFAHDGQVRIKLPPDTKQEEVNKYESIAQTVAEKLMPVTKTLRGKCSNENTAMNLLTDSKKKVARIDWSGGDVVISFF